MVVILIVGGEPSAPSPPFSPSSTTVSIISSGSQVSPDDPLSTTKEEEWIKTKKVEVITKRQIATRVQREVVLEDGKVVQDSGPKVTTTTTEDTEKQESENTERHDLGDGNGEVEGWKASGEPSVLSEVREKKVTTREEREERVEMEDIKHLGDISDEAYRKAVESGDVGGALVKSPGLQVASLGPRVVGQTSRLRKVTDTEDTVKKSGIDPTGKVITNTTTTKEHEEVKEEDVPEDELGVEGGDSKKEDKFHFVKSREEELVDYLANGVRIGGEMRYNAETTEGGREGETGEWDSLSERLNKMRRGRLAKEAELDRKDALTRCPLDLDQEERTRKAETSKWLEHHFGSESTSRSSKDSDEEGGGGQRTTFINVTMKSSKDPEDKSKEKVFLSPGEPKGGGERLYFKGVREWRSEERKGPQQVNGARVQVLPTGPNHTFEPPSKTSNLQMSAQQQPNQSKSPSPPPFSPSTNGSSSPLSHKTTTVKTTTKYMGQERTSSPLYNGHHLLTNGHHRSSPVQHRSSPVQHRSSPVQHRPSPVQHMSSPLQHGSSHLQHGSSPIGQNHRVSPLDQHRMVNGRGTPTREPTPTVSPPPRRRNRKVEKEEDVPMREEPAPDYSPVSEHRASPIRVTPDSKRKVYQRTRFAADIPPPQREREMGGVGEKERGKGRNGKGKRGGLGESFRRLVGKLRSGSGERKGGKKGGKKGGIESGEVVDSGTQTPSEMTTLHRYYLGEDPFGGSIYGKESEYDGISYRRKYKKEEESRHHSSSQGSSTLGRLSKSTGKLSNNERPIQNGTTIHYYTDRGGVQTLPRRLQEHKVKKEVHVTRSNGEVRPPSSAERYNRLGGSNSSSMFNVSIVNNVSSSPSGGVGGVSYLNGPAKPARTYKSNLLRSKSFNVQAGEDRWGDGGRYTSNPQLHRLDESPAPLKSPGIVTSISRSTKDISEALAKEEDRRPLADRNRYLKSPTRSNIEAKKKIFMKGLMERAPELYQKLHGDESGRGSPFARGDSPRLIDHTVSKSPSPIVNGYGGGGGGELVNRSIMRRGSGGDYSETVRYKTKSDDPLRPSITESVQSFTKKTLPSVGGRRETIESTETKTVTKSRFRSGTPDLKYLDDSKYSTGNGGVIIEVRNTRK